jgi:hypothetical protein
VKFSILSQDPIGDLKSDEALHSFTLFIHLHDTLNANCELYPYLQCQIKYGRKELLRSVRTSTVRLVVDQNGNSFEIRVSG